jgi:hypothetical protein
MASYSLETLPTRIEYHSADPYDTYTTYNLADVCWDVLNDIMSSYYLHIYQIFGLNGLILRYINSSLPCTSPV